MEPRFDDKPGLEVRATAAKILAAVVDKKISLDGMLDPSHGNPSYKALNDADRALTRAIVSATLRHLPRIEAIMCLLVADPLRKGRARFIMCWLRRWHRSSILTRLRTRLWISRSNRPIAIRAIGGLPSLSMRYCAGCCASGRRCSPPFNPSRRCRPGFFERLVEVYGREAADRMAEAQLAPAPIDLTVKADAELWAEKLGAKLLPTGSLRLPAFDGSVTALEGFAEGAWWVQDAAAALPAQLFDDLKGKRVADLCAAPGGKTAQLIAAGANVIAVEQSANRAARLRENLTRLNLSAR